MNKKLIIFILAFLALTLACIYILFKGNTAEIQNIEQSAAPALQPESGGKTSDLALKNALNIYASARATSRDFSDGPCLGEIASDWVLDIAHNPRQEVDEESKNQCQQLLNGKAHHFIELDPEGNLIRML